MSERVILVDSPNALNPALAGAGVKVEIHPTVSVVGMDESPSSALRTRKDSSIAGAVQLVAGEQAGALVSAGNTGAVMAFALRGLKRLPGLSRPAIAAHDSRAFR